MPYHKVYDLPTCLWWDLASLGNGFRYATISDSSLAHPRAFDQVRIHAKWQSWTDGENLRGAYERLCQDFECVDMRASKKVPVAGSPLRRPSHDLYSTTRRAPGDSSALCACGITTLIAIASFGSCLGSASTLAFLLHDLTKPSAQTILSRYSSRALDKRVAYTTESTRSS